MSSAASKKRRLAVSARFDKIDRIGRGDGKNSRVWLAYDRQRGEKVILKEIDLATFDGDPDLYFEESQAICAAACERVVPLYFAGKTETHVYLAMPIMSGSLAEQIRNLPLSVKVTISVGKDICAGMGAVHKAGRLHLDLKPTNVLFNAQKRAMIADFGQALRVDGFGISVSVGEPRMYAPYWPPEAFEKTFNDRPALTVLSDVYQIGLTLYCAVNGDALYREQLDNTHELELATKIAGGQLPERELFLPHVPDYLRRVIRKAMAIDPADRYESAAELADALGVVDPKHEWRVTRDDDSGYTWHLDCADGRADVIVQANRDADGFLSVEVWTQSDGAPLRKRGATGPSKLWAKQLTRKKAFVLLKRAFRSLP